MRFVDILLSMPPLLLILVFVTALPRSNVFLVILVGALLAPGAARIIRGLTLQVTSQEYVAYAQATGERSGAIIIREILPNVRARLALEVALRTGFAVLVLVALNFLGVGVSPPSPDWGLTISEGRAYLTAAPLVTLLPSLGVVVLIVSVNLVANSLDELWK
jgi:peptide/nickel transport system permease protein